MKEKERVRRALLCWLAGFLQFFGGGHGVLVERGLPSFLRAAVWLW